jgi:hypothetical protein
MTDGFSCANDQFGSQIVEPSDEHGSRAQYRVIKQSEFSGNFSLEIRKDLPAHLISTKPAWSAFEPLCRKMPQKAANEVGVGFRRTSYGVVDADDAWSRSASAE